ncbi:unnamed protein product [Colias eurytheme]|nr:unnamed protein product [Colias eurytheme]
MSYYLRDSLYCNTELNNITPNSAIVKGCKDVLLKELKRRYGMIELNDHAAIAKILDPRFKNLHFQDPSACGRAIQKLRTMVVGQLSSPSESEDDVSSTTPPEYDFWKHHKELAHGHKKKKKSHQGDEVSLYLSKPVVSLKSNPFAEWDDMKVAFDNINVVQNNVFPVLTAEELTLFSVGTYQIKLAPSYYSEHIRNVETFVIQQYNGDLSDLSTFNMPSENVHLFRFNLRSRHTSSKVYHSYILVDSSNTGLAAIRNYCCTCFTGRRTIGCCAHTMCLVWFLGWARHQDVIRCPALFLDKIIIDDDDDDD